MMFKKKKEEEYKDPMTVEIEGLLNEAYEATIQASALWAKGGQEGRSVVEEYNKLIEKSGRALKKADEFGKLGIAPFHLKGLKDPRTAVRLISALYCMSSGYLQEAVPVLIELAKRNDLGTIPGTAYMQLKNLKREGKISFNPSWD